MKSGDMTTNEIRVRALVSPLPVLHDWVEDLDSHVERDHPRAEIDGPGSAVHHLFAAKPARDESRAVNRRPPEL